MGKTFQSGHSFPAAAGFTGSSGGVAMVRPFTRKIGARKVAISPGAPQRKIQPKLATGKLAQGPALAPRVKAVTQADKSMGKTPLLPGYKKGGAVKDKC